MDIQAIIKQVISLAGVVIKNPSTSVKSSGIDFGSLIGMAGSMMGNKSGGSSQGGMDLGSLINIAGAVMGGGNSNSGGNVLGSVLGGLAGAQSKGGPSMPQQGGNDGGLGSILGGLAGMAAGGSSQQGGGGLGDILGGLAKAGLGNAMGNMFSREEASSLMSDVSQKEKTISDMLKDKNLNADQKGNLTDMLGLLKVAGSCLS